MKKKKYLWRKWNGDNIINLGILHLGAQMEAIFAAAH
jgi:hypothetical protein